jgi:hypothetical protein
MTLSALEQHLQGCGCEQGLTVLWDLAQVLSPSDGSAVAAEAGGAAGMPAQQLLQFLTNPQLLVSFKQQLQHCADQQDAEHRRTADCVCGLQQLLAQPVVAAVLGWDSEHGHLQMGDGNGAVQQVLWLKLTNKHHFFNTAHPLVPITCVRLSWSIRATDQHAVVRAVKLLPDHSLMYVLTDICMFPSPFVRLSDPVYCTICCVPCCM